MISAEKVAEVVKDLYGLSGVASALGSCQDINFKFSTSSEHEALAKVYVVKFTNASICTVPEIEFQHAVIEYLHTCSECSNIVLPLPLAKGEMYRNSSWSTDNECISEVEIDANRYFVRLLKYVDGIILSEFTYFSSDVLHSFGAFVGSISKSLIGFQTYLLSKPQLRAVANREIEWDLRRAETVIDGLLPTFSQTMTDGTDAERHLHATFMTQYTLALQSLSPYRGVDDATGEAKLRVQILHGDLAHYNVVAQRDPHGRPYVTGVIDFGDAMCSWTVGELAVAIVSGFASDGANDCALQEACAVVKGFISVYPLNEWELMALWPLVVLRSMVNILCISKELESDPHNQYNLDGLAVEWRIFDRITQVPLRFAQETIRWVAGLPTSIDTSTAAEVLQTSVPMMDLDASMTSVHLLDLSAESDLFADGRWLKYQDSPPDCRANQCVSDIVSELAASSTSVVSLYVCPYGVPQMQHATTNSLFEPTSVSLGLNLHVRLDKLRCSTVYLRAPFDSELSVLGESNTDRPGTPLSVFLKSPSGLSILLHGNMCLFAPNSPRQIIAGEVFVSLSDGAQVFVQLLTHEQDVPERCTVHEFPVWSQFAPCPYVLYGITDPREGTALYQDSSIDGGGVSLPAGCDAEELQAAKAVALRNQHVAAVQEHYFKHPPRIERGFKQHLYSPTGRGYLDMVNNVAVLGHCHAGVFAAATKQMRLLNTNSRFVYKQLGAFAEKIIATMPPNAPNLNAVFFVNSGSEATDLALRLARTVATYHHKQALLHASDKSETVPESQALCRDVICLEGAYHGVTTASDEVSTTLNDNPNALESRPDWIHLVPMPNPFRGRFAYDAAGVSEAGTSAADKYADFVSMKIEDLAEKGRFPAVFIAEPLSGNAGGVELPPGYLKRVYQEVRQAGGLCIADEVQVGYGRLGTHFWGFQEHDVVPDIVTMAKAAGNGHPLGYVVTSKENVRIFGAESGSFFSSAGGGPVSCAIGSAVLDAVHAEQLQHNAAVVGAHLTARLNALQAKHSHIVGCIHGHGLYQGIELVRNSKAQRAAYNVDNTKFALGKEPATREAYAICERLLNLGVICHNTGDYSNVLKVKPPLCMTLQDADFFVDALDICLRGW